MAVERTQAVGLALERPMDAALTEQCPWCGAMISKSKFLEIETKIRSPEDRA